MQTILGTYSRSTRNSGWNLNLCDVLCPSQKPVHEVDEIAYEEGTFAELGGKVRRERGHRDKVE